MAGATPENEAPAAPSGSRASDRPLAELAVAVVSWNTREHLRRCLASVEAEGAEEVVVVDNASSDGSPAMVRAEHPRVRLLANPGNTGYGAAANQAVTACTAPYVLLLNADTRVCTGSLAALAEHLDRHPGAGLVGPRLLNPDGTLQVSCQPLPTPLHTLLADSPLWRIVPHVPVLRRRSLYGWSHDRARVVPWVKGAALAIRRAPVEEVGGFDPAFFLYYEEVDLCHRLAGAGWTIHFAPAAEVVHVGGASTVQDRAAMAAQRFAGTMQYYRRHYSGAALARGLLAVRAIVLGRWIRDTVRFLVARDAARRAALRADATGWGRVLTGRGRGA
jgi:hypothetical protein